MAAGAGVGPDVRLISGWGRTAPTRASVHSPRTPSDVRRLLEAAGRRGAIARGLGRSYGDAAQNAGGAVLDMTGLAGVRRLDPELGTVTVDAGVSLDRLVAFLVARGWFLPVTPGTRFVTVGGAIASDVHGKNHHRDGGFCDHVVSLELITPGGEPMAVGPDRRRDVFLATAGGMGLTGVIVSATLRLLAVETSRIRVDTERAGDLDDAMARLEHGDGRYRYSVAWIDLLAGGSGLGRSVLLRGDHATLDDLPAADRRRALRPPPEPRLAAPPWVPPGLLRRSTVGAFNALWFRRAPREERGRLEPLHAFFYPLDAVRAWNRLYGRRGLIQYQLVVPFGAEAVIRRAVERLSAARCPSFLGVLKRFGPHGGMLSFPLPGWTLALDVPAGMRELGPLLAGLDALVADAGGRVYLAKDARLRSDMLEAMYPRLNEWRELQARLDPDGVMQSDLARRLALVARDAR